MSVYTAHPRPTAVGPATATGLRIHTHGQITPVWVRDTVVPVWESARAGGRNLVALRRGWLGGPHVEIAGVGEGATTPTWSAYAPTIDTGPPPATPLDHAEYLDGARARGRIENIAPPYLPLREHGAVVLLQPDNQEDTNDLVRLGEVTDGVLAPAVVATLRTLADHPDRLSHTIVDILTCLAKAHTLGPGYGTFSLRSHAEALLANWSPSGDLRAQFCQRYTDHRTQVVERVQALLEGCGGARVTDWHTGLAYVRGVIDEAVRRGELTNALVDAAATGGGRPNNNGHPDTEFHQAVYGSGVTDAAGEWFAGYRFLVNRVYSQLPLLGVSPLARAYGCWAVSEAIDEVTGQSWTERLAAGVTTEGVR